MTELAAFVGHSFDKKDEAVVSKFLEFFDHVANMPIGFSWEHAEEAKPKLLSHKVREKIEGKNLFIGICTAKETAVPASVLSRPFLMRNSLCAPDREFTPKTSDWILQEIGCAFGRDMDIILLKEQGLRDPGGIQGDLEYITFDRNNPEESFSRILEMLQSLLPHAREEAIARVEKPQSQELDQVELKEEAQLTLEIQDDWQADDYHKALFRAIALNDEEYEEKVFEAFLDSNLATEPRAELDWRVWRKYFRTSLGKSDHLDELIELASAHPENDLIQHSLGRLYMKYEQHEVAAGYFERSAELAEGSQGRAERLIRASRALSNAGDYARSLSLIEGVKALAAEVPNLESILLETLAETRESEGEIDQHFALMEAYLEVRPNDHEKRFSLAFKYADQNQNDLALYHYSSLANQRPGDGVFNNLGVSYAHLNLPSKSVEAYRSSQDMDGTTAMSNLANKLIHAGFLSEAEELSQEALKRENYDKAIGLAISQIKEVRKNEGIKEEKILKALRPRRDFYVKFGRACLQDQIPESQGVLTGPKFDLEFVVQDNSFRGQGTYLDRKKKGVLWVPQLAKSVESTDDMITYRTEIIGSVLGHAISYSQWTFEDGKARDDDPDTHGLMIAASDLSEIEGYEIGGKEGSAFFQFSAKAEGQDTSLVVN